MLMLCLKIKDEEKDVREGEGVVEGEEDGVEGKGEGGGGIVTLSAREAKSYWLNSAIS